MQLLRSVTNSQAMSETSIIRDASKYIEELKHKVETANQHLLLASSASIVSTDNINYDINHHHNNNNPSSSSPPLEKGFLVKVYSERSCPGLLVALLEAFEELGLNVLEARVSSTDHFHLQALGGGENEDGDEDGRMNTEMVIEAISRVIKDWNENKDGDGDVE
ncbi:unnamed protein product [Cuscuta campestris]|uniref:Plant bHLH transcription factor ACT-like domain-containing protein n=1 Tax=Cuscuta campestris TaxID=132261 RepID=A0A484LW16_9ASTE|nr:unnamed protein product [Cuscuta campestris]